jgi:hypothetical protein
MTLGQLKDAIERLERKSGVTDDWVINIYKDEIQMIVDQENEYSIPIEGLYIFDQEELGLKLVKTD